MELDAIPQTPNLEAEGIAQVHPSHGVVVSGGSIKEESHRISFCYGLLVFFGLCLSLLTLTLLVVYVGVWSQHTLYGNNVKMEWNEGGYFFKYNLFCSSVQMGLH